MRPCGVATMRFQRWPSAIDRPRRPASTTSAGTSMPSSAARFRLSANSTFGTSWAGRSAGLAPFRMLSTNCRRGGSDGRDVDAEREERTLVVLLRVDPFLAVGLDGQVRRRRQPEDLLGEVEPQAGRQDEHAVDRARSERVECGFEAGVVGCLVLVQLDPELAGGIASLDEERRRRGVVGRIDEREQPQGLRCGQDLPVDLELLGDRVSRTERPGQVPARVREAVDQAVADRIGRVQEDDRDPVRWVRGRVLRRARSTCPRTRRSGRRARERIPGPAASAWSLPSRLRQISWIR